MSRLFLLRSCVQVGLICLFLSCASPLRAAPPAPLPSEAEFRTRMEQCQAVSNDQMGRGDLPAAVKTLREGMAYADSVLGAGNAWSAMLSHGAASCGIRLGQYAEALQMLDASIPVLERNYGRENEIIASMLMLRGFVQGELGQPERGLLDLQSANDIAQKICPPGHNLFFSVLKRQARIFMTLKQYDKAEAAARAAIAHVQKHEPANTAGLASARTDLDHILTDLGRWKESRALQELIYPVFKADTMLQPADLGYLYESMLETLINLPDLPACDRLMKEALELCERHGRTPEYWQSSLFCKAGSRESKKPDVPAARAYYQRALDIAKQIEKADPTAVLMPLAGLGWCDDEEGDAVKAEGWYTEALRAAEAIGDSQRSIQAWMELNIGRLALNKRDYARAQPHARRSVELYRAVFTADHYVLIAPLTLDGEVVYRLGRTNEALRLLTEAATLAEKYFERSPDNAISSLETMAYLLRKEGQSAASLARSDQLLAKATAHGITTGAQLATVHAGRSLSLRDLGRYEDSLTAAKEALRLSNALHTGSALQARQHYQNLVALATWNTGRHDEARALVREALPAMLEDFHTVLATSSEAQRLAWSANAGPQDLPASFGMAEEAASVIATTKSAALDSIMAQRRAAMLATNDPRVQKLRDEVEAARLQLSALLKPGAAGKAPLTRIKALQEEVEQREQTLFATLDEPPRRDASAKEIAARLPTDAVLLDWFRHRRHTTGKDSDVCYGLVLHRPGKVPALFDIGPAHETIAAIIDLLKNTKSGADEQARNSARILLDRILGGAARELTGVKTLYLCPDDILHLIPFAVLPNTEGRLLGERFAIRRIVSARDLLRDAAKLDEKAAVEIFASPQYRADPAAVTEPIFADLPATRRVAKLIQGIAKQAGRDCTLRIGADATEAAIRRLRAPGVLHFDTHGYYASAPRENLPDPFSYERNDLIVSRTELPMERCGIALAGAEDTLRARNPAAPGATRNDGMLMAAEAAELSLHGTWLVVVDACSTARGALLAGDGVASVQRGFQMAGAEHVAAALWPVYDEPSAEFMADFYPRALRTGSAAQALIETQMQRFRHIEKESGWAEAFILTGSWIITSRGR